VFVYLVEFESAGGPERSNPFATASEATEACLTYIDEYCSSIGGIDAADITLGGGDLENIANYPNMKFEAGPPYRNWFDGNVYNMEQEELAREAQDAIERLMQAADASTARHSVPLGQLIDAATCLHQKLYPKRRGTDAPNLTQFLDGMFKNIDSRTRQRHRKAYCIVASDDWPAMDKAYPGTKRGLERILDAAKQFAGRPATRRATVSRKQYDRLLNRYEHLRNVASNSGIDDVRGAFAEFDQEDENDATPEEPA
jgi:hypothetical protein